MENTAPASISSKTTPKDFFLWLLTVIALYGSITSLLALLFEYINYSFPDALAYYGDPYGGAVRFSMAALVVLVPTLLVLLRLIRGSIVKEPGKATIWVRRWALGLTLFIATVTILIDLVTLINTFLGGEISIRFGLKVAVVLLVALGVFLHFLADFKGYWIANVKKANLIGIGVGILAFVSVGAGFFIIGTPSEIRLMRFDEQKVNDLQNMQYQVLNYWQLKKALPQALTDLNDPLQNYLVPTDPQPGMSYTYEATDPLAFKLCATFNAPSSDMKGRGSFPSSNVAYPMPVGIDGGGDSWTHEKGLTCFERTIDPSRYPSTPTPKPL